MSKAIIRTELWNTRTGKVIKAVARDEEGRILGATNQTAAATSDSQFTLVGRK